jgi:membrane-associated phospholipid phosphatase
LIIVALLALAFVYRRFRRTPNDVIATTIEAAAAFIGFVSVSTPITYLCARTRHEMIDFPLRQFDHALGFDWDSWNQFIQSMPAANLVLDVSYKSLLPQAIIALFFLPRIGNGRRAFELIRQGTLAMAITCLLFWLFPAMGAAKAEWTSDMELLRGSSPLGFDIRHLKGIISFPSFHAVIGVLFVYACRGTRLLLPAIVLNALMVTSALSEGKHYLTDVVVGLFVALVSIVGTEWLAGHAPMLPAAPIPPSARAHPSAASPAAPTPLNRSASDPA